MIKEAIVLAGGLGTRLSGVIPDLPKCLAPINGTPFITLLINYLKKNGIKKIFFSLGYKSDLVIKYLNSLDFEIDFEFVIEKKLLGTGGAIKLAVEKIKETQVLVVNGDTFFNSNLNTFYIEHIKSKSKFSINLNEMENFNRFGSVIINDLNEIISFKEKTFVNKGFINSGQYLIDVEYFKKTTTLQKFSLENDFFPNEILNKSIHGFYQKCLFIDIGIPDDYIKAQQILKL